MRLSWSCCFTLLKNEGHLLSTFLKKSPLPSRSPKAHSGDGVSRWSHTFCPTKRSKEVTASPASCSGVAQGVVFPWKQLAHQGKPTLTTTECQAVLRLSTLPTAGRTPPSWTQQHRRRGAVTGQHYAMGIQQEPQSFVLTTTLNKLANITWHWMWQSLKDSVVFDSLLHWELWFFFLIHFI